MNIKDFLKEFFNKPALWVGTLVLIALMTIYCNQVLAGRHVKEEGLFSDTVDMVGELAGLGKEFMSDAKKLAMEKQIEKNESAGTIGDHLFPFGVQLKIYVGDSLEQPRHKMSKIRTVLINIGLKHGVIWMLAGFLVMGIITRKSINCLYSVGPFIVWSIVAIIIATNREKLGGEVEILPFTTTPAKAAFIWRPGFVEMVKYSVIAGLSTWMLLWVLIKLRWLDGMDEYSYRSLSFSTTKASDDIKHAASKAQGVAEVVVAHPTIASAIGKAQDAGKKLGTELSNIGNSIPQELGLDAHRCPFCGWPEFNNKGCCRKCDNQVRKIPMPTEGHVCSGCGSHFLSIAGVNFCYFCGKFLHDQYEETHPSSDVSKHDKESLIDLSDDEILAPISPGMEEEID